MTKSEIEELPQRELQVMLLEKVLLLEEEIISMGKEIVSLKETLKPKSWTGGPL